jgi:hypothetical protein
MQEKMSCVDELYFEEDIADVIYDCQMRSCVRPVLDHSFTLALMVSTNQVPFCISNSMGSAQSTVAWF